jgi:hypothetical protein
MTLLLLLFHTLDSGYLEQMVPVLAVGALVLRSVRESGLFWLLLSAPLFHAYLIRGLEYPMVVNHKYLIAYWVLLLGIAFYTTKPWSTIRWNARLIIGLCFAFATLWKLISPEFADGTFFEFRILTDPRFRGFAEIVIGLPEAVTGANTAAIDSLRHHASDLTTAPLETNDRVRWVAKTLALWTIIIEGLIAIAFLLPERRATRIIGHFGVMIFILTTYPIATVPGFARLLTILAFASCHPRESLARGFYLVSFIAVPTFDLPWVRLLRPLTALWTSP